MASFSKYVFYNGSIIEGLLYLEGLLRFSVTLFMSQRNISDLIWVTFNMSLAPKKILAYKYKIDKIWYLWEKGEKDGFRKNKTFWEISK